MFKVVFFVPFIVNAEAKRLMEKADRATLRVAELDARLAGLRSQVRVKNIFFSSCFVFDLYIPVAVAHGGVPKRGGYGPVAG